MLKSVDVVCRKSFILHGVKFSGYVRNIKLSLEDIRACLECKAKVFEIATSEKKIPLDFSNYKNDNGGIATKGVSEADWKNMNEPKVEVIGKPQYNHIDKKLVKETEEPKSWEAKSKSDNKVKDTMSFSTEVKLEQKKEDKKKIVMK